MRQRACRLIPGSAFGGLWLMLGLVCALPVAAQNAPQDVPPDHWAYEAVRGLADKGLVTGYPDGRFLGNRTVTRYEMATIIQRVLRHIEQMQPTLPPTPQPEQPAPPAPGVGPADLAEVRRLVEEFKVELTVIGTDMKAVKDRLDALEQKQSALEDQVTNPEGAIQTTVTQVQQLRRLLFSGYIQARYNALENSEEGSATVDTFTLPRVRLSARARPSDHIGARLQADFAASTGNPPGSQGASATVALRDAWINWYPAGDPAASMYFTLGQFKYPFGFVVPQSSTDREVPERPIWAGRLLPGERDRGAMISSPAGKKLLWELAVLNGTGRNAIDNNFEKDIVGRVRRSFGQKLNVGISGYVGEAGISTPASGATPATFQEFVRNRYGADFQLYLPGWKINGEYVQAKERGREPWGWDAQIVRSLGAKMQLVARYDEFDDDLPDPTGAGRGKLSAWNLGLIRYLDLSTRLKLFYSINQEERNDIDNDQAIIEFITLF